MQRSSLTLCSIFCLCLMMPTGAATAKTVHIGAGHTQVIQLSGGRSYKKRLRRRKRRATRQREVQLHSVSIKMPTSNSEGSTPSAEKAAVVSVGAQPKTAIGSPITSKATDPRGVYEEYVAALKAGRDPEKVMLHYLSKPKKVELINAIQKSEKMRKFGLKFIAAMAKCTRLTFIDQKMTGNKAVVSYRGEDICSKKPSPYVKKTERVEMIKENGRWKLETSSSEEHDFILLKVSAAKQVSGKSATLEARYDPLTVYESYLHQIKKEHGFRDAVEFFTTQQKKEDMLKLFNHPKKVVDQTIKAITKSTKCTSLKLVSEKIKNGKATIKYKARDICTRDAKMDRFEIIELLKVKGFWKVNKITGSNI